MDRRFVACLAATFLTACGTAHAADDKAEIVVHNNTAQSIRMRFDYAFRDRRWNLADHPVQVGDDLTYRFPTNIPGCEYLRQWRITDGVLSIWDASGLFCEKRISLCDKQTAELDVQPSACYWTGH